MLATALPIHAEDTYVFTGTRNVRLEQVSPALFTGLSTHERTIVALALIALNTGNHLRRATLLDTLQSLPDGNAWKEAAISYIDVPDPQRQARLIAAAARQGPGSPAAHLLLIERAAVSPPSVEALAPFGPALQSLWQARRLLDRLPDSANDLAHLVEVLELPLSDAGMIPFGDRLVADLPGRLQLGGLPLEAAIVARALQRQKEIREIEKQVPEYLLRAGDIHGALKSAESLDPMLYRNSRRGLQTMEWMILAGDYRRALDIHSKYLSDIRPSGDDAFGGFPMSRSVLRTRSAVLLYLLGDAKEALLTLDAQAKSRSFDSDIGYARLLQAQLMFEENTDLSGQIAEDLTYRAQEKSLYLLEYHATVLEGLALQRQGKDYQALINFVKARGIARSHLKDPPMHTLLLGELLVGLKLSPGGSYRAAALGLLSGEEASGENEALRILRDGMPARHRSLVWKKAILENLVSRKLKSNLVELLQAFLEAPVLHGASGSPGGLTGISDVWFWNRQLATGLEPLALPNWKKDPGLTEKSRNRMAADITDGTTFLIVAGKETMWVFLKGLTPELKTGFIPTECLETAASDCDKDRQSVREVLKNSKSVFFPSGFLPDMDLPEEPRQLDWRMVHSSELLIAAKKPATDSAWSLCSKVGLSERTAKRLQRIRDWSGSSLLLGGFQKKNSSSPVYLSQLSCPTVELRLWDLDRFTIVPSESRWVSPSSGAGGAALARLVTRSGSEWIEYDNDSADEDLIEELIEGERPRAGSYRIIRSSSH